jgi:predicted ATPase/DNA-binding SARP family transcriptional activator
MLLGSPTATIDGLPVRGFVSSKATALLYYLAATKRTHSRSSLASLFWPETSEAQALKNLRDVLSNLRQLIDPALAITRQSVAFRTDLPITVDVWNFEAEIVTAAQAPTRDAIASLRSAVAHYRGPFLDGFTATHAVSFETWAAIERERLQRMVMDALGQITTNAISQGAYADGVGYASRRLAIDPTCEACHRHMIELLARSGQRGAALAQYATCRRILADELGLDPEPETEALYRQILDGLPTARTPMVQLAMSQMVDLDGIPAVAPRSAYPTQRLPTALVPLIGRHDETHWIIHQVLDPPCRLVTITGHGGIGKTSLALHVARQLESASVPTDLLRHGIIFVPLASLTIPSGTSDINQAALTAIATRIADALGFTLSGIEAADQQILRYLNEKALLIILDNCEHLPVAHSIVALLEHAPQLKIIATSRSRLHVLGEQVIELEGLPFPTSETGVNGFDSYSAVQLFRRTAQATSTRLVWNASVAESAARICRLVAGLPLAIDLAASLARLMPIAEIAEEIAKNLEVLQSTRADLPDRHRSLRAVFDHSWRLLDADSQRTLRQLTVFRGGFTRHAAAQVAEAQLPALATLVENSLLRQISAISERAGRYDLPELVRQYAAERLAELPDDEQRTSERHASYYRDLLVRHGGELRTGRQQHAAMTIADEMDNIRVAWDWAVVENRADLLGAMADGLFFFLEMRSWFREGTELFGLATKRLTTAMDRDTPTTQLTIGKLLARQGWCQIQLGRQSDGAGLLQHSLGILQALDAGAELIVPLNYAAASAYYSGDYAGAEELAHKALARSQTMGERHGASVALTILGQIAALVGDYEQARGYAEASLIIERELDNRWGLVFPLISLGQTARASGNYQAARAYFQEAFSIRAELDDTRGMALCLNELGDTALALGEQSGAGQCYEQSYRLFHSIGNLRGELSALRQLGQLAKNTGKPQAALRLYQEALQRAQAIGLINEITMLQSTLDTISGDVKTIEHGL